jgi:hypothetical protein
MTASVNLAFRSFNTLAGIALIVYSFVLSSSRTVIYVPAIFGVLLIIQGLSGT